MKQWVVGMVVEGDQEGTGFAVCGYLCRTRGTAVFTSLKCKPQIIGDDRMLGPSNATTCGSSQFTPFFGLVFRLLLAGYISYTCRPHRRRV